MEPKYSENVLKSPTEDIQLPFLPPIQPGQTVHRQRSVASENPGNLTAVPRLPPICSDRVVLRKRVLQRLHHPKPSNEESVGCQSWTECSRISETLLPKLTAEDKRWKSDDSLVKRCQNTYGRSTTASPVPVKGQEKVAENSTTACFSKPRFGRRSTAQRSKLYRTQSKEVLDSEILTIEEKNPHLFAARDVAKHMIDFKDMQGKRIESSSVYKDDITRILPDLEEKNISCFEEEKDDNMARQDTQEASHKRRVRRRFFEALDLHFYNNFVTVNPGRRMAICEEIERTIVADNVNLAWYREHLRLQEVLDSWVL